MTRGAVKQGPDGARIEYVSDTDGFAMQNGGMFNPTESKMPPGIYYRFFGTINRNRYGAEGCMAGGWWVDGENYAKVRSVAQEQGISLAKAAQALIVIPGGWHDCGYVGRALLKTELKAWVGKGKPATSAASPFNKLRNPDTDPVQIAPAHLEMKQWFVPGERALLSRFFEVQQVMHVIAKGVAL
ncbi:hypothetical protein [Vannielia litorea]|uniref:Uncharacterized protein n=1 Tax=Vannielia litorea TaxID=1217970 RepID=A0A1N6DZB4_9RHOB|nr:hypothetical protein [Vannielia litorea]SIN76126.1 hypothetical protein SAMN05444002_0171 [Vannielia litorea]